MKKILICLFLLFITLSIFCINASAQSNDSRSIPEDVVFHLEVIKGDCAVKFYTPKNLLPRLAEEKGIDEILEDAKIGYSFLREDKWYYCRRENGAFTDFEQLTNLNYGEYYYQNITSPQELFAQTPATKHLTDIEFSEIYCLVNSTHYAGGIYTYFITNHGDFIYQRDDATEYSLAFLIPVDQFYKVADLVCQENMYYMNDLKQDGIGYSFSWIHNLFDLEPYLVGGGEIPQHFYDSGRTSMEVAVYKLGCKSVISGGAGALLLCGAALTLITKKKRRSL